MERMATRGFDAMSRSCAWVCDVEEPAVLSHMPHPNFGLLDTQKMGQKGPKNLSVEPPGPMFSTTVPKMAENTVQKWREAEILKEAFVRCAFFLRYEAHSKNMMSEKHAFFVHPPVD